MQQFLDSSATRRGFSKSKITEVKIEEQEGYYKVIAFDANVTGNYLQVMRWIAEMHEPELFRAVTYMKLVDSKDADMVNCLVRVQQYVVEKVDEEENS